MDTRGQGSEWSPGDTPDIEVTPTSGQHPGFMTRGIDHRDTYYYRRLITDAVLALDAATRTRSSIPIGSPSPVISQGGGLALAVAGLSPVPKAATIDVPGPLPLARAVEITDTNPYREVRALPRDATRPRGCGLRDPRLLRRHDLRVTGDGTRALLGRADGRDLRAVDRSSPRSTTTPARPRSGSGRSTATTPGTFISRPSGTRSSRGSGWRPDVFFRANWSTILDENRSLSGDR
jgi:hypothetical protein